jgi:hypothetical protein
VKQIRIERPRVRREHPGREVLPPNPREPDVVRAKALARQRERERRRLAKRYGLLGSCRRRRPARRRLGRALAGIGLALARGSSDA